MDAGKFQLVTEADVVLSNCGRFVPPVGSVVYIPHAFLLQAVLGVGANNVFYIEVTGDTTWCWRSISIALSGNAPAVYAQVLKPDGHFLFNGLMDLTQVAGFGSNRFLLTRELEVPPGSKIQLTLDDHYPAAAAVQPVSFLAEGAYAYYLKNGRRSSVQQEASQMERITGTVNQNLMAPCWMSGNGPKTPHGFRDEQFTYGNGVSNVATVTLGGNLAAKCSIQIDNSEDFEVRRFLFDVTKDAGVTGGTFTGRIRNGSGYAFTDDYIDLPRYLGSSYWAKDWHLKRGDQILFDLVLVDGAGAGNMSIEVFAEGVKRRRAA
jgi:hypothetical protein